MKKRVIVLFLAFFVMFWFFSVGATTDQDNIESDISASIDKQIEDLDFSKLEELLNKLDQEQLEIFGQTGFVEKVKKIINGDFKDLGDSVLDATVNLILEEVLALIPLMATILAIGILSGMLGQLRNGKDKGIGDIIHFVCYGLVLILISSSVIQLLKLSQKTLATMKAEIDVLFPILLTLMSAVGGTVSVGVYQPAVALLSGSIMQIFNLILVPIFVFSFVFAIISNLTNTVKVDKFVSFLNSAFKWIIGLMFTIFLAFVSIKGITAGAYDGISVKTAKFAIKSYVPILGGYLADGFNVIMASSVLIKNSVGLCGLLLIVSSILVPIISIMVFSMLLKLTGSILEPLTDGRISTFLFSVSKTITMLLVILIGVAFMFLILIALVMFSANFF